MPGDIVYSPKTSSPLWKRRIIFFPHCRSHYNISYDIYIQHLPFIRIDSIGDFHKFQQSALFSSCKCTVWHDKYGAGQEQNLDQLLQDTNSWVIILSMTWLWKCTIDFFSPCVSSVGSTAPISVRQRKHLQEEANNQNRIESELCLGKLCRGSSQVCHISVQFYSP